VDHGKEQAMTIADSHVSDAGSEIRQAIRRHWGLFLAQGIIMIVLGVLALARPMIATLAVEIFAGWLFLIGGIVGLAGIFTAWRTPGFVWGLIRAIIAILVGVLLLWRPLAGVLTLTLLLAAFFAAEGITQIIVSISQRALLPGSWIWVLLSGIINLILAAIIISGFPGTAAWVLGLLVGINLLMSGVALVTTALACRSVADTPASAAPAAAR
jgi:uncharacterized membrane protein HdeD (DUF308 family)